MRKKTLRSGLRFIALGILCLLAGTFLPAELSRLFFMGIDGEARITFLGFFLGGMFGGFGVLVAAAGLLLQGRADESHVRLAPTIMLLVFVVALFFFLTYNSMTVPTHPQLQRGESINI
jgi:hypothetical protein